MRVCEATSICNADGPAGIFPWKETSRTVIILSIRVVLATQRRVKEGACAVACMFTVGYEGRDVPEFAGVLRDFKVDVLVDVREKPISRKRGFAKSALRRMLESLGKSYLHVRSLGSPKALRDKLKREGDYRLFFAKYREHASAPPQRAQIRHIRRMVEDGANVCLMCYERDASKCHRSVVAEMIREDLPDVEVIDI